MIVSRTGQPLPFKDEQVFDVASDIERYPEFLPGWIAAHIRRRDGDVCYVEQTLGFGPIRLGFASRALLQRPRSIDVSSAASPFRRFNLGWRIDADGATASRVSIAADVQLQSGLLQHVVDRVLPSTVDDILAAFQARMQRLHGAKNQ